MPRAESANPDSDVWGWGGHTNWHEVLQVRHRDDNETHSYVHDFYNKGIF